MKRLRYAQALLLLCAAFLIGSAAALLWSGRRTDGWRVTTERADEPPLAVSEEDGWPAGLLPGEVIDLNTASESDLSRLPGIGEKRARAIAARRAERPFADVEELTGIDGIGQATLERLRPYICVTP